MRSVETKRLVDTFLICTVVTILAVRFFLIALGYPRLGGDGLHIAHLLWGGLLLLIALMLAMVSLSQLARRAAAVLGGVGFGLLIDEIGKFVTTDNDYFFRPTFALIYVTLVLIWLASRTLLLRTELHPHEQLANAIDLLREATVRPLTEDERSRALRLVEQSGDHPFVPTLGQLLETVQTVPATEIRARTLIDRATGFYERLVTTRVFKLLVSTIFVLLALVALISVASLGLELARDEPFTFANWAQLATNAVLSILYCLGVYALFRRSRITAYRWFELSMLFSIFVVQIFDFADLQLAAVIELVITLVLLVSVRLLIAEEERLGATAPRLTPATVAAVLRRT